MIYFYIYTCNLKVVITYNYYFLHYTIWWITTFLLFTFLHSYFGLYVCFYVLGNNHNNWFWTWSLTNVTPSIEKNASVRIHLPNVKDIQKRYLRRTIITMSVWQLMVLQKRSWMALRYYRWRVLLYICRHRLILTGTPSQLEYHYRWYVFFVFFF